VPNFGLPLSDSLLSCALAPRRRGRPLALAELHKLTNRTIDNHDNFRRSMQRAFALELKSISDTGEFEGFASVYNNRDEAGDVVLPGAYTAMSAGTFLAGSAESAEVIDRMDATIEISLDHSDYRARNLAMVLCECRSVLCIYRPSAFVYGTLNSSPA